MQAGIRVQGAAMHWWSEMIQKAGTAQQAQRRARSLMLDLLPKAQKNAGQYLSLLSHNYHISMDLLRKAFAADQSTSYGEAQKRMLELWQASLQPPVIACAHCRRRSSLRPLADRTHAA